MIPKCHQNTVQRQHDAEFKRVEHDSMNRVHGWLHGNDIESDTHAELLALIRMVRECRITAQHIENTKRVARSWERDAYAASDGPAGRIALSTAIAFDEFVKTFSEYAIPA